MAVCAAVYRYSAGFAGDFWLLVLVVVSGAELLWPVVAPISSARMLSAEGQSQTAAHAVAPG